MNISQQLEMASRNRWEGWLPSVTHEPMMTTLGEHVDPTLGAIITINARRTPSAVALSHGPRSLTYSELDSRTDRLANALRGTGLSSGDRLAAWMDDGIDFVEVMIACLKAGIILAPVSKMFTAREAANQLEDVDPAALVFTPGTADKVEAIGLDLSVRLYSAAGAAPVLGARTLDELIAGGLSSPLIRRHPDEVAMIGYTSGTTGRAKGSAFTHASINQMLAMQSVSYRLPLFGKAIFNSSVSFVGTVTAFIWSHFYVGGSVVLAPGLEVEEQLRILERERGTFMYLPTPSIDEFLEQVSRRPATIDTLVSILHSGSKARRTAVEHACEVLGGKYLEGYGQTENSGGLITAMTAAEALGLCDARDIFDSVGRPTVGTLCEIVDDDENVLSHDGETVGELVYRSPGLMKSYWRNDEAFATANRNGWFHSGDLATIDHAGYIYIVDRRSDLIVSGGANVSPTEVEDVISEHTAVREATAVGTPHDRWGRMVVAVVVLQPGLSVSEAELLSFCRERLASYKCPKRILIRDHMTYSASHKIRRFEVRDWATEVLASKSS